MNHIGPRAICALLETPAVVAAVGDRVFGAPAPDGGRLPRIVVGAMCEDRIIVDCEARDPIGCLSLAVEVCDALGSVLNEALGDFAAVPVRRTGEQANGRYRNSIEFRITT